MPKLPDRFKNIHLSWVLLALFVSVVLLFHKYSDHVFYNQMVDVDDAGVALLQDKFDLDGKFRKGGYFTQAVYDGYNKFTDTPKHSPRFTGNDKSCSDCHAPEDMAYAFIQMDRFDIRYSKRVSFEEQVMRCYVKQLDGHVPPFYDPALQNLKIFARFLSIGYGLQEGSLRETDHE